MKGKRSRPCACAALHEGECKPALIERRKPDEIMAEYTRVLMNIGDLEYRHRVGIPKTLAELYDKAERLNHEHAESVAAQTKESKPNG